MLTDKKRIVVFGATGTLGLHFVDSLHERLDANEWEIVATGRKDVKYFDAQYSGDVRYCKLDIADRSSFSVLPLENVYGIVHFAGALPAYMEGYDPYAYVNSNVLGTLNVLEYGRSVSAERLLYTQTISDYDGYFGKMRELKDDMPRRVPFKGDHSVYAITKTCAEDLCWNYQAEYGIKCYSFRLPNIYCYMPEAKTLYHDGKVAISSYRLMIRRAMAGEPLEIWGDPQAGMDLIYVKDFCQECACALLNENPETGTYNVGTGKLTSLDEFVHAIAEVFNPEGKASEIIYRPEMHDCVNYYMNIDKARKNLGYEPQFASARAMLEDYKREMELNRFAPFFEERWGAVR